MIMKRLWGNFHMLLYSTSWTERLSKRCVWEKKLESYFEEREQYEANLRQETGCSKMLQKCCALSIHYSNPKMTLDTKLSLFKTAVTQDIWLFPLQLHYELSYTSWAQLAFTKVTSPYDNCRYSFQWNNMTGTLDNQEEDCDKSFLRIWATPAIDQNLCGHTSIYERSVRSGSHSRRKRGARDTFL